jgi:hypothetical protein
LEISPLSRPHSLTFSVEAPETLSEIPSGRVFAYPPHPKRQHASPTPMLTPAAIASGMSVAPVKKRTHAERL